VKTTSVCRETGGLMWSQSHAPQRKRHTTTTVQKTKGGGSAAVAQRRHDSSTFGRGYHGRPLCNKSCHQRCKWVAIDGTTRGMERSSEASVLLMQTAVAGSGDEQTRAGPSWSACKHPQLARDCSNLRLQTCIAAGRAGKAQGWQETAHLGQPVRERRNRNLPNRMS